MCPLKGTMPGSTDSEERSSTLAMVSAMALFRLLQTTQRFSRWTWKPKSITRTGPTATLTPVTSKRLLLLSTVSTWPVTIYALLISAMWSTTQARLQSYCP
jgi:hypothetical protein